MTVRASLRRAITPARHQAYDRRIAAVHEAGHMVIAHRAGAVVRACIFPNPTIERDDKTWVGSCTIYPQMSHAAMRQVGVAGFVAEQIWRGDFDGDIAEPWEWECDLQDPWSLSPSDWRWTGCEPGAPDEALLEAAASVAVLLAGELWPDVTNTARELMSGAHVLRIAA